MPRVPETRASLILRLPSSQDADAWQEFVSIYEPFVFRFARRGGLEEADARELVQDVLISVANAVGRWKPDSQRGRFRTWLFRIARNQLLDVLAKRQRRGTIVGADSAVLEIADDQLNAERVALEHRRALFQWAADRVRRQVRNETWQAFRMTAIDEHSMEETAETLNLTVGAVYIARSRVLARLRDEVRCWEDDDEMSR